MGPWQQCRNWTERREMGFPETIRASGRYEITRAIHRGKRNRPEGGREMPTSQPAHCFVRAREKINSSWTLRSFEGGRDSPILLLTFTALWEPW